MTTDIVVGWSRNQKNNLFAPRTFIDCIQDKDGTSLKDYIKEHGGGEGGQDRPITSQILSASSSIVKQSSSLGALFEGYHAFDGMHANNLCQYGWLSTDIDDTPWISYNFLVPVKIEKMEIEIYNNGNSLTKNFKIQGSNDEVNWEDIDTIEIEFPTNILKNYTFNFDTTKTYRIFRILGDSRNYYGPNETACTFSEIKISGIEKVNTTEAQLVTYDNSSSELIATNVQAAIDEINNKFEGIDQILDFIL